LRSWEGMDNHEISTAPSARLFRANVSAMAYFWVFVAISGFLFLAMFYMF